MGRKQRSIITLTVTVLLLGGLAGVYFWRQSQEPEAEADESQASATESITLIERQQSEISTVDFISATGTVTLAQREVSPAGEDAEATGEWYFPAHPEAAIDQTVSVDMARGGFSLIAEKKILDAVDNPAEYGFDPPAMSANVTYTDGTTREIRIGSRTPDQNRYYLMVEGDPALYLLYTYYGDRYFKTENDMIDRTLADFTSEAYEYILISERGEKPVEFDFLGTDAEAAEMIETYGTATLTMTQPYYGRELYYSNFKTQVTDKIAGLELGDLIEYSTDSLSKYGLEEPSLEFRFTTVDNDLHLFFGDRTDDGKIYVMYGNRTQIFVTDYSAVSALFEINPFAVIDKFLALINIDDCESIYIAHSTIPERNLEIVINNSVLPPEEGEEEGEKIIEPTINGKSVDEDPFRDLYRQIIGLSADSELEFDTTAAPVFSVTYNVVEGDPIEVTFYEYDANFYAAQRAGDDYVFAVNKQSVEAMFETVISLA